MDQQKFSQYLTTLYSDGMVMLAIGLGHELGLFKVLLEADGPLSLNRISSILGLKERYVQEWLSCMVVADILHQDTDTLAYFLPEAHKQELRIRVPYAPFLFELCGRKDAVGNCFKKEGPYGVSYSDKPSWFKWCEGYRSHMSEVTVDSEIIPKFKEQGLVEKLETGVKVLDVGCGSGNFTLVLAKRFPKSTFIGMEYVNEALEMSRTALDQAKLTNVTFEFGDAHAMSDSWTDQFDLVFVYDTLHDLSDPPKCLDEVYRVLKDDGVLSLVEIGVSSNPQDNKGVKMAAMYYAVSMFVCLQSSMAHPPHRGYGACWGVQEIEKTLQEHRFKIHEASKTRDFQSKAFFYCTK